METAVDEGGGRQIVHVLLEIWDNCRHSATYYSLLHELEALRFEFGSFSELSFRTMTIRDLESISA